MMTINIAFDTAIGLTMVLIALLLSISVVGQLNLLLLRAKRKIGMAYDELPKYEKNPVTLLHLYRGRLAITSILLLFIIYGSLIVGGKLLGIQQNDTLGALYGILGFIVGTVTSIWFFVLGGRSLMLHRTWIDVFPDESDFYSQTWRQDDSPYPPSSAQ